MEISPAQVCSCTNTCSSFLTFGDMTSSCSIVKMGNQTGEETKLRVANIEWAMNEYE